MITQSIQKHKTFLVGALLACIASVTFGLNMFNYPSYFDDEGTYMAQAWAVAERGELAPYTYWYDHAPFGWILIALWTELTGGLFTFDMSVNSGRVFMLVLNVANVVLLYALSYRLTSSRSASAVGSFVYAFSPLVISIGRIVFLDTIMLTLVLSSLLLIVVSKRLTALMLSAVLFGASLLSKETSLFFIPGFILALWYNLKGMRRLPGIVLWLSVMGSIVSLYILYALINGEFFIAEQVLGVPQHVSLIETYIWQSSRTGGSFLDPNSEFQFMLKESWMHVDAFIMIFGAVSLIGAFFLNLTKGIRVIPSVLGLLYSAYLLRGGIVNDQYIIPLLPFFAISIAQVLSFLLRYIQKLPHKKVISYVLVASVCTVSLIVLLGNRGVFMKDYTSHQIVALEWIKENLKEKLVSVDGYGLVDLQYDHGSSEYRDLYSYIGPHHYWKLDQDTRIVENILGNDWTTIEYVMVTNKVERDSNDGQLPFVRSAISNATLGISFPIESMYDDSSFEDITIARAGNVDIYKINTIDSVALKQSYEEFIKRNLVSYGQIVDRESNTTTADNQASVMLRAVWMKDKTVFDGVWQWTEDHLRHREGDLLVSQEWSGNERDGSISDSQYSLIANTDIAEALILASKAFNDPTYLADAEEILGDLWENSVHSSGDRLSIGTRVGDTSPILVDIGSLSPAAYVLFADVDSAHPWMKLREDTYHLLDTLRNGTDAFGRTLPPAYVLVGEDEKLSSAKAVVNNDADLFSIETYPLYLRLALDYEWNGNPSAGKHLEHAKNFFLEEWKNNESLAVLYTTYGKRIVVAPSTLTESTLVTLTHALRTPERTTLYNTVLRDTFQTTEGIWSTEKRLIDNHYGWFSTAFYSYKLTGYNEF